jgi:hypothetical protein
VFDPRDDARDRDGPEDGLARTYDERDRDDDAREGLMRDLDLPRGEERELVALRDRVYELDGEDSRTLAAVGTFRVVPEHDLDIDHETIERLHDEGLVEAVDLGDDERGLTLTRAVGFDPLDLVANDILYVVRTIDGENAFIQLQLIRECFVSPSLGICLARQDMHKS